MYASTSAESIHKCDTVLLFKVVEGDGCDKRISRDVHIRYCVQYGGNRDSGQCRYNEKSEKECKKRVYFVATKSN